MLGNFEYFNPTKIYFGKEAIQHLLPELKNYGQNVTLVYGKNSIKKIGLYDEVVSILKQAGKSISEISGVMPNPTIQKVYEGIEVVKENKTDLLLAVGGGSVIDYAKAVAGSAYCNGDPWEKFYIGREECTNQVIPVGCILTMVGTGSEMNDNGTITNHETKQKIGYKFGKDAYPKFAIMNPEYTYSVSYYQFASGTFDIMSHIMEQYFSNEDDNVSDDIAEGLMRSVIRNAKVAKGDLTNYEARSNLMWAATWALNNLIAMGKTGDWEVHMMGQAIAAFTDATHGMTLSCISIPYYRLMAKYYPPKFARFAVNVWGVDPGNKTNEQIAEEGLNRLKDWMIELGVAMSIKEVGISEDMIEELADNTPINDAGYHKLSKEELIQIYKNSL
ncbi:iron-containing alcohol dehydrogenase [Traorella massiliensis]|uniref:iron-containing alcohol dehydrogenase n=1 Tax=Traorella massiliensis TaxID=1903263 RepID=UPI0008F8BA05|nr:iron-containing alcohol dehydrogenase [Traorella massiliensis]